MSAADVTADVTALLAVLQLSDSAFPSGRYTLSHGLESCAQSGLVTGRPAELAALLTDCLRHGVARSDGVALACAHRAASGSPGVLDLDLVTRADRRLTAVKLSREAREASTRTGRALLATATAAFGAETVPEYAERVRRGEAPGNHAVIVGLISARAGVARVAAVAGDLFAFASGWVAAAVRLALVDHRVAQWLLHRVRAVMAEAAPLAAAGDVADIAGCTPLLDVASMRHEQAELRLFAS